LSGPPQIHVQGRVERGSNALAAGQPAPGGRLAGSSSDRAPGKKSALAPNGRSLRGHLMATGPDRFPRVAKIYQGRPTVSRDSVL